MKLTRFDRFVILWAREDARDVSRIVRAVAEEVSRVLQHDAVLADSLLAPLGHIQRNADRIVRCLTWNADAPAPGDPDE